MLKRFLGAVVVAMLAGPCLAQTVTGNEFQTGQTGKTVPGTVMMCANSSGVAVPASNGTCANPLQVSGSVTSSSGPYPTGATPITSSSGNQANAAAVATLAGVSGKTTYLCGFEIDGGGATAAVTVNPTVAGTISGTLTYLYGVGVVAAGTVSPPLQVAFNPCVPASAANTAIIVTLPALGAGNLNAIAVAHGYQF